MEVYLIRHAIAEPRDPGRWPDDSQRPLTLEGARRFHQAALGLKWLVPVVDQVLSSRYTRTWHTAQILAAEAGWPRPVVCRGLEPERALREMCRVLRGHAAWQTIALVGHGHHLNALASYLLSGDETGAVVELKKGGVIALSMEDGVAPRAARLRWALSPKVLRSPGSAAQGPQPAARSWLSAGSDHPPSAAMTAAQ